MTLEVISEKALPSPRADVMGGGRMLVWGSPKPQTLTSDCYAIQQTQP